MSASVCRCMEVCVCVCGKQAFSLDGFIVHVPGVSRVRVETAVVIVSKWKCGFINGNTVNGVLDGFCVGQAKANMDNFAECNFRI